MPLGNEVAKGAGKFRHTTVGKGRAPVKTAMDCAFNSIEIQDLMRVFTLLANHPVELDYVFGARQFKRNCFHLSLSMVCLCFLNAFFAVSKNLAESTGLNSII